MLDTDGRKSWIVKIQQTTLLSTKRAKWALTWDFQQCGMYDQQWLRPTCAYAQSDQSLCRSLKYSMTVKLLTEQHLQFLNLKGGCTGWSESTLVKMPHVGNHVSRLKSCTYQWISSGLVPPMAKASRLAWVLTAVHFRYRSRVSILAKMVHYTFAFTFYHTLRLAPVLKTIFHQCVIYTCSQSYSDGSVLKQSHQSKTGYKYMIWHIDEKLF